MEEVFVVELLARQAELVRERHHGFQRADVVPDVVGPVIFSHDRPLLVDGGGHPRGDEHLGIGAVEPVQGHVPRLPVRLEQRHRRFRVLVHEVLLERHHVADGEDAGGLVVVELLGLVVAEKPSHARVPPADGRQHVGLDDRIHFPRQQHVVQRPGVLRPGNVLQWFHLDVRGPALRLRAGHAPPDARQVHAVVVLERPPRPHPGGAAHEHALPLQVLGGLDARGVVDEDVGQPEFPIGVGRDRNVGVLALAFGAHEAAEAGVPGVDDLRAAKVADLEIETLHLDGAVHEGPVGVHLGLPETEPELGVRHRCVSLVSSVARAGYPSRRSAAAVSFMKKPSLVWAGQSSIENRTDSPWRPFS